MNTSPSADFGEMETHPTDTHKDRNTSPATDFGETETSDRNMPTEDKYKFNFITPESVRAKSDSRIQSESTTIKNEDYFMGQCLFVASTFYQ